MTEIRFTVPGPSVPKARPRVIQYETDEGLQSRGVTPARTEAYETIVGYAARAVCPWDASTNQPVSIVMWFYMPDRRRRDLDNAIKAILDGITGVLIEDDNQVVHLEACKSVDRDNPRTEVVVRVVEEP